MKIDYNAQADLWSRDSPMTLSDYVARAKVLEMFDEHLSNMANPCTVLDIGCGEGYFARQAARLGAKVVGIDESKKMIAIARKKEKEKPLGIEYHVGNALSLNSSFPNEKFDCCVGNFIAHYFNPDQLFEFYGSMTTVMGKNGCFILSIPHPCFQLLGQPTTAIYEKQDYDYVGSRGGFFQGYLPTTDGRVLKIGYVHSTLEDHFDAINAEGLVVTRIKEPVVSMEIAEKHELFSKTEGKIGFMVIEGKKPW
jgi:ubiquinone/menaquinone biosynthesis C-methylase UbiE